MPPAQPPQVQSPVRDDAMVGDDLDEITEEERQFQEAIQASLAEFSRFNQQASRSEPELMKNAEQSVSAVMERSQSLALKEQQLEEYERHLGEEQRKLEKEREIFDQRQKDLDTNNRGVAERNAALVAQREAFEKELLEFQDRQNKLLRQESELNTKQEKLVRLENTLRENKRELDQFREQLMAAAKDIEKERTRLDGEAKRLTSMVSKLDVNRTDIRSPSSMSSSVMSKVPATPVSPPRSQMGKTVKFSLTYPDGSRDVIVKQQDDTVEDLIDSLVASGKLTKDHKYELTMGGQVLPLKGTFGSLEVANKALRLMIE
jgi:chromosome segregation ATPase